MSSLRFAQELDDRVLEISPGGETRVSRHTPLRCARDIGDRVLEISPGGETRGPTGRVETLTEREDNHV